VRRAIELPTQRGATTNNVFNTEAPKTLGSYTVSPALGCFSEQPLLRVYRVLLELHIDPVWIDDVETGSALFIDRLDPLRS
jgi:hypothetical protein